MDSWALGCSPHFKSFMIATITEYVPQMTPDVFPLS
jgi:hypothetical protein